MPERLKISIPNYDSAERLRPLGTLVRTGPHDHAIGRGSSRGGELRSEDLSWFKFPPIPLIPPSLGAHMRSRVARTRPAGCHRAARRR